MLHSTHVLFFTPLNVQFFRLCFSSYKCALWLHYRQTRDVSSGCDQRCPNWQRHRLRLALQLLTATTPSAQTAANGHKRQVRDMICQFAVWIWGLVLFWSCYSDSEWWSLRTMVILAVKLLASSLAFRHEILYVCSPWNWLDFVLLCCLGFRWWTILALACAFGRLLLGWTLQHWKDKANYIMVDMSSIPLTSMVCLLYGSQPSSLFS